MDTARLPVSVMGRKDVEAWAKSSASLKESGATRSVAPAVLLASEAVLGGSCYGRRGTVLCVMFFNRSERARLLQAKLAKGCYKTPTFLRLIRSAVGILWERRVLPHFGLPV
jgi:hypothetical protein